MMDIKIDKANRLFVIPCCGGFSCLGFDVERADTRTICEELGLDAPRARAGTKRAYAEHRRASKAARVSGRRLQCGLHPKLKGLEGRRVECTLHGERVRVWVGRSTGYIPCHLEVKRRNSSGGCAIRPDADLLHVVILERGRA